MVKYKQGETMNKTTVMRILEQKGIEYTPYEYDCNLRDGQSVAQAVNILADKVFKTLVTVGSNNRNYVFVIPVNQTLNLKKCANAAKVKSIEMIKQKDLLPLTGYIHGGCSPIGMKKPFETFVDDTAQLFDSIVFSAGKIGYQVEVNPQQLLQLIDSKYAQLTD